MVLCICPDPYFIESHELSGWLADKPVGWVRGLQVGHFEHMLADLEVT